MSKFPSWRQNCAVFRLWRKKVTVLRNRKSWKRAYLDSLRDILDIFWNHLLSLRLFGNRLFYKISKQFYTSLHQVWCIWIFGGCHNELFSNLICTFSLVRGVISLLSNEYCYHCQTMFIRLQHHYSFNGTIFTANSRLLARVSLLCWFLLKVLSFMDNIPPCK